MIRDRGAKWTSLMLTEHIKALRTWQAEDQLTPDPELTEWDLVSLQEEMEIAFKKQCLTIVTVWRNGREFKHRGKIIELDTKLNSILFEDPFEDIRIPIVDIIKIRSM